MKAGGRDLPGCYIFKSPATLTDNQGTDNFIPASSKFGVRVVTFRTLCSIEVK